MGYGRLSLAKHVDSLAVDFYRTFHLTYVLHLNIKDEQRGKIPLMHTTADGKEAVVSASD